MGTYGPHTTPEELAEMERAHRLRQYIEMAFFASPFRGEFDGVSWICTRDPYAIYDGSIPYLWPETTSIAVLVEHIAEIIEARRDDGASD